jgi:hypothetical protein
MQGIQKSGEAAQQFGVDLDQLIGYITAVQTSTRESGNVIGNGFKTIFSRIEMDTVQDQLKALNIAVKDTSGDLRPLGDIYSDLALKWNGLNREAKMQTALLMAGRFHIVRFLSLMDNWQIATDATTTSQKSLGSAIEENYKHQKSLESQINRIKAAAQEFAVALGESGVTGVMGVLMNSLVLFTKGLTEITTNYNGAASAIGILALAMFFLSREYVKHIELQTLSLASTTTLTGANLRMAASVNALGISFLNIGKTIKAFALSLLTTPMGWLLFAITALTVALPLYLGKLKQTREEQKKLNETLKESNDRLNEIKGNIIIGASTMQNINDLEAQIQKLDQLSVKIKEIQGQRGGNIPIIELPKEQKDYLMFLGIDINKLNTTEEAIGAINTKIIELNDLQGKGKQVSSEYFDNMIKKYYLLKEAIDRGTLSVEAEEKAKAELASIKGQLIGISSAEIAKIIEENGVTDDAITKIRELIKAKQDDALATATAQYGETNDTLVEATNRIAIYDQEIAKLKELSYQREKGSIWEYIGDTSGLGIDSGAETDKVLGRDSVDPKAAKDRLEALEQAKWYEEARAKEANDKMWSIVNAINNRPLPSGSEGAVGDSDSASSVDEVKDALSEYVVMLELLEAKLQQSKAIQELYSKESKEYRDELTKQITLLKTKQDILHAEAEAARALLATGSLTVNQQNDLNKSIMGFGTEWSTTQKEINSALDGFNTSKIEELIDNLSSPIDRLETKIKSLKKQLTQLEGAPLELRQAKTTELADAYAQLIPMIKQAVAKLQQESSALLVNSDAWKTAQDKIQGYQDALETLNDSYFADLTKAADDIISMYKDVYEKQKQAKLDAIDDELKAEEDRHDQIMDNLDDELDKYNDIIDAKIKSIEKESDERSYAQDLGELQKEAQTTQNKIDILSLDDSIEAKQRRAELEKSLAETNQQIEDLQYDHGKELRIDSLNEQKDAFGEGIDAKKEAEDEMFEATQDRLEAEKKEWEDYYNDLINDERRFAQMRDQIMKGNFDNITSDFKTFQAFISSNMTLIGKSISTNLIDKLWEAVKAGQSASTAMGQIASSLGITTSGSGSGSGTVITSSMYENLNGTAIMPSRQLASLLGTSVSWDQASGQVIIGGQSFTPTRNVEGTTWVPIRQVAEKLGKTVKWDSGSGNISLFHKGGVVGGKSASSGIYDLINKFLNVEGGEQLIKAVKNEIMLAPQNVPNFLSNMKNLVSSVTPVAVAAGNSYQLNFNIENMSGNKKDADSLAKTMVTKLKSVGAI